MGVSDHFHFPLDIKSKQSSKLIKSEFYEVSFWSLQTFLQKKFTSVPREGINVNNIDDNSRITMTDVKQTEIKHSVF